MNDLTQGFADILKAKRKERKLSQKDLAKLSSVPQSHISNIENGKVNIRLSSLFEIARILGVEPMLVPKIYVPAVKGFVAA